MTGYDPVDRSLAWGTDMALAQRLSNLGTETAFAVSLAAADWASKGNRVFPFHLGDINLPKIGRAHV